VRRGERILGCSFKGDRPRGVRLRRRGGGESGPTKKSKRSKKLDG